MSDLVELVVLYDIHSRYQEIYKEEYKKFRLLELVGEIRKEDELFHRTTISLAEKILKEYLIILGEKKGITDYEASVLHNSLCAYIWAVFDDDFHEIDRSLERLENFERKVVNNGH